MKISLFDAFDNSKPDYKSRAMIDFRKQIRKCVFVASGFSHLPDRIRRKLKKVKIDDKIELVPDPKNKYDNEAVSVKWKKKHIGWISLENNIHRSELFNALMEGKTADARVHYINQWQEYWDISLEVAYIK